MKCRICKKERKLKEGKEILNPANGKYIFICNDCLNKRRK